MSDIAIRVENLSKRYRIGRAQQRHDTLRDAISDFRLQISDLMKRNPRSAIRNPQSAIPLRCAAGTIVRNLMTSPASPSRRAAGSRCSFHER